MKKAILLFLSLNLFYCACETKIFAQTQPEKEKTQSGPPDRDKDGVEDSKDTCPDQPGRPEDEGCPVHQVTEEFEIAVPPGSVTDSRDSDQDGTPDKDDRCPGEIGPRINKGCPQVTLVSSFGQMVLVQGGVFTMGSKMYDYDEQPMHSVTVSSFYLGKYEVTVGEFKAFVDDTGYQTDAEQTGISVFIYSKSINDQKKGVNWRHDAQGKLLSPEQYNHPVVHVSWNDAIAYCKWKSEKTGKNYRLPTEAEWEYAAGGGEALRSTGMQWDKWGNPLPDYEYREYANYINTGYADAFKFTAPAGSFRANVLDIFDMNGNVSEWCSDWNEQYVAFAQTDPTGPATGESKVVRGGNFTSIVHWGSFPQTCRNADRASLFPGWGYHLVGFRLAASLK